MFEPPIPSFLGISLCYPSWFSCLCTVVVGCVCSCLVLNRHHCCDIPCSCSFCTISSSSLGTYSGRFFCCFGCTCYWPLSSCSGVFYWLTWAPQSSFVALAPWWQALHSGWLPAGCVPVVLFSLVLPLPPLLEVHVPFLCGDIVDAFLSLSLCVDVSFGGNVCLFKELLAIFPCFGVFVGYFPLCHCFLRKSIRFIHLIDHMYDNIVIWHWDIPFCWLLFCLLNLFEVSWEDLGLFPCYNHFSFEVELVFVDDFAYLCLEVYNDFIWCLSAISDILFLPCFHKRFIYCLQN